MNRKLFFTLFGLVLAGLLTACSGAVPVTADPTVVPTDAPPTAVPSPTPTLEPTAIQTDIPTQTVTPFVPPELATWAAANGFEYQFEGYHKGLANRGIYFLVWEDGQYRTVKIYMAPYVPEAERKEALDTWVGILSELFGPDVAKWVAGLSPFSFESTYIWVDGYGFNYYGSEEETGGWDVSFEVTAFPEQSPADPGYPDDDSSLVAESVEVATSQECLVVTPPAGLDGEELDNWMNQYLDNLSLEVLREEHPPQGSEVFITASECVVVLYRDPTSGESFLIYETEDGFIKVPFDIPSVP